MKKYVLFILTFCACLAAKSQGMLSAGEGVFTYKEPSTFADRPVNVHYYIPEAIGKDTMRIVFVFHGADRGWETLMDTWGEAARKNHFMVFIPHFTSDTFPNNDYQEAGVVGKDVNVLSPHSAITPVLIDSMFKYIQRHTVNCPENYSIYGHSAGGQFVHRFLLLNDSPWLDRAVIGSPGWYTFPDKSLDYPYGIGNVPYVTNESMRKMFSRDVTVELSECDTVREWFLRKTPEAEAQGRNRLDRGLNYYAYCRKLCTEHGWDFNWRCMVVPKLGHQSAEMGMAALPILLQPTIRDFSTPTLSLADTTRFATTSEISKWIDRLVQSHASTGGKVVKKEIGITPDGRRLPLLIIDSGNDDNPKVWLQGGLHGNEPAGPETMCYVASWLLNSEEGSELLKNINVAILPVANPDGYDRLQRLSGNGIDLNRDQSKAEDPITTILKKAWTDFNPDVSFDLHEYNPHRKEMCRLNGHKLETDYDVLLLPSGHPNIDPDLRNIVNTMMTPAAETDLKERAYKEGIYFTPKFVGDSLYINLAAKSPQSSSTWCGLADAVSLFAEIKGIGYGRHLLEKRVDCGFTVIRSMLRQTAKHHNEIKRRVGKARERTLNDTSMVTVAFAPDTIRQIVDFYDTVEGKVLKADAFALDAMNVSPIIKRMRHKGYILNSSCGVAAERLKRLGFKVQTNKKTHKYFVSVAQPRGNLLVTLLEPESYNGFVYFGVIKPKRDGSLPYKPYGGKYAPRDYKVNIH